MKERIYIAIDLKSYYSSVECVDRGLDPLNTNLVVADASRTEKTICLAVSPSLKAYGIPGRPRLFEVVAKVKAINEQRKQQNAGQEFAGASYFSQELQERKDLALDYIVAPPRMARYMKMSAEVHKVYLRYVSPKDIYVYSVDEVFIDATNYLPKYKMTAHQLALTMIRDVLRTTGITATAGIGTNLYLCKIAMDIIAKHVPADKDGVRIAELDEQSYRRLLWAHQPITDFWRIGKGYASKLAKYQLYTMGDIARCSMGDKRSFYNADLLYKLFGVNAELLIDHAWGYEPCTLEDIRNYEPENNSVSSGQVLDKPYSYAKGLLIIKEMTELLVLDLLNKHLVTDQIVLTVGYDVENLQDPAKARHYQGEVHVDRYGRSVPKHAHGTASLGVHTSSRKVIMDKVIALCESILDPKLFIRRVTIAANHVRNENSIRKKQVEEIDIFAEVPNQAELEAKQEKEKRLQQTVVELQRRFGKNGILKGMNLEKDAKTIERNGIIGGHKA